MASSPSLGCVISGRFLHCGLCGLECNGGCADFRSRVLSPVPALSVGGDKLGVWGSRMSESAQV